MLKETEREIGRAMFVAFVVLAFVYFAYIALSTSHNVLLSELVLPIMAFLAVTGMYFSSKSMDCLFCFQNIISRDGKILKNWVGAERKAYMIMYRECVVVSGVSGVLFFIGFIPYYLPFVAPSLSSGYSQSFLGYLAVIGTISLVFAMASTAFYAYVVYGDAKIAQINHIIKLP